MRESNLKIAFTGPESSGKTTLANWVAESLGLKLSPEYAREHLQIHETYTQETLDIMAQTQFDRNNSAHVCDTEMLVFAVWSVEKYGNVSPLIQHLLFNQTIQHYFLCSPDIPWEYDPLRENPYDREQLFKKYHVLLEKYQFNYTILKGSLHERKSLLSARIGELKNG
jgi:nicotinamide riboside kinase